MSLMKQKDFITKINDLIAFDDRSVCCFGRDFVWCCVWRGVDGFNAGFVIGLSDKDDDGNQYTLASNNGNIRVFKTLDAVQKFASKNLPVIEMVVGWS